MKLKLVVLLLFLAALVLSIPLDETNLTVSRAAPRDAGNRTRVPSYSLDCRAFPVMEATDEEVEKALCRGARLIDAVRGSDEEAAKLFGLKTVRSPFNNFPQDLDDWGWYFYNPLTWSLPYGRFDEETWGVASALKGIGVADTLKVEEDDAPGISLLLMQHGPAWGLDTKHPKAVEVKGDPYYHNGKEYLFTQGFYSYGINAEQGVIIVLDIKSPAHSAPEIPKSQLPDLQRASDVMYGVWKLYHETIPVNNLRFVLTAQIVNELTQRLIITAMDNEGWGAWEKLKKWPGTFFGMGTTENLNTSAVMLLGSPLGTTLAYMLIQHKDELGDLRIVSVTVFLSDTADERMCMLWHVKGPVPHTPGPKPKTPKWPVPKPPKRGGQGNGSSDNGTREVLL